MTMLADTLTTREALRRAVLDDIVARADIAGVEIEGGALDGVKVVSIGTLRDEVTKHLQVALPPPSEQYAQVVTPATITVAAMCPECDLPNNIVVKLSPQLTVTPEGSELAVKSKTKARVHVCGQLPLSEEVAPGQETLDEAADSIDDLRLRILGAVYDLEVERDDPATEGPEVTLELIAKRLEFATDSDRGDLEDALYGYSQTEPPLVEVESGTGHSPYYSLTDAGTDLVDKARAEDLPAADDADDELGDPDDSEPS